MSMLSTTVCIYCAEQYEPAPEHGDWFFCSADCRRQYQIEQRNKELSQGKAEGDEDDRGSGTGKDRKSAHGNRERTKEVKLPSRTNRGRTVRHASRKQHFNKIGVKKHAINVDRDAPLFD